MLVDPSAQILQMPGILSAGGPTGASSHWRGGGARSPQKVEIFLPGRCPQIYWHRCRFWPKKIPKTAPSANFGRQKLSTWSSVMRGRGNQSKSGLKEAGHAMGTQRGAPTCPPPPPPRCRHRCRRSRTCPPRHCCQTAGRGPGRPGGCPRRLRRGERPISHAASCTIGGRGANSRPNRKWGDRNSKKPKAKSSCEKKYGFQTTICAWRPIFDRSSTHFAAFGQHLW